jgi:hypothetical protein
MFRQLVIEIAFRLREDLLLPHSAGRNPGCVVVGDGTPIGTKGSG